MSDETNENTTKLSLKKEGAEKPVDSSPAAPPEPLQDSSEESVTPAESVLSDEDLIELPPQEPIAIPPDEEEPEPVAEKISLQVRPEMDRPPQKELKGGPRLANKKPEQAKARENTELVKGANTKLKRCPKCKTETAADDILCEECGYNFETEKMQLTPRKKKKIRQGFEIAFWGSIIALSLLSIFRPQAARLLYDSTLGPHLTPVYEVYIQPYLTGEHDPELQAWFLAHKKTPTKPIEMDAPKTEPLSLEDINALRTELEAKLDSQFPLLKPGDQAQFTTTDGQSADARFIGIEEGQIILEVNGQNSQGPVDKLITDIRLRVDMEFREKYINRKLEQLTEKSAQP